MLRMSMVHCSCNKYGKPFWPQVARTPTSKTVNTPFKRKDASRNATKAKVNRHTGVINALGFKGQKKYPGATIKSADETSSHQLQHPEEQKL